MEIRYPTDHLSINHVYTHMDYPLKQLGPHSPVYHPYNTALEKPSDSENDPHLRSDFTIIFTYGQSMGDPMQLESTII